MSEMESFFEIQTEQSEIKARIVSSYFISWSRIIKRYWNNRIPIAYIDLFCGPGVYADGSESVPIKIVRSVLRDSDLSSRMIMSFNDEDPRCIKSLKHHVNSIDTEGLLRERIMYSSEKIDNSFYSEIEVNSDIPVLSFVDPFGYQGITRSLIRTLINNNGSECIFFFNYNRINMALSSNNKFDAYLADLFGEERTNYLKEKLRNKGPQVREIEIVNATIESLREIGDCFVLPFKFYRADMHRTSHFIVFVTKHKLGYKIMKNIMYSVSAKDEDGVALFEYHDKFNFGEDHQQLSLMKSKIDDLCDQLIAAEYKKPLEVKALCEKIENSHKNPYVAANVKEALRRLEERGSVIITGRKRETSKGVKTMPDGAVVSFTDYRGRNVD